MESTGILTSRDVDMDQNDTLDLEYDELALYSCKRRRKGSGSFSFTFTASSSIVEPDTAPHCHSACPCNSDSTMADKSKSTTATLRFQCLVPAAKICEYQFSYSERPVCKCRGYGGENIVTTLHLATLVSVKNEECAAVKTVERAFTDKFHGRAQSICRRYGPEVYVGSGYVERDPKMRMGFPAAVDRDKYKKWTCKNDLYEFRTSKYHQVGRSISFLDRLRAAQATSACISSQCSEN